MLSGIKIIEFEGLGPAPFAGRFLAELGADVLVVKNFNQQEKSLKNSLLNAGKKSVFLDLKNPRDHSISLELIRKSDALVEGFRPGVMERLKLGPTDLKQENKKTNLRQDDGLGPDRPPI